MSDSLKVLNLAYYINFRFILRLTEEPFNFVSTVTASCLIIDIEFKILEI